NAGIVITARSVAVGIRIIIVAVIIGVPGPPRIKSEVEDEPGAVDETAAMAIPPVFAPTVPISMPVARVLSEHVIPPVRREIIAAAGLIRAASVASRIHERLISSVRRPREMITGIIVSDGELPCSRNPATI